MILFILLTLHSFFSACTEVKADNHQSTVTETVEIPLLVSNEDVPAPTKESDIQTSAQIEPVVEEEIVKSTPVILESTKEKVKNTEIMTPDTPSAIVEETPLEPVVEAEKEASTTVVQPILEKAKPIIESTTKEVVMGHADFDALLKKYVKNGRVNYAGFKADSKFAEYLSYLSNNAPSTSDKSKGALAFWMNAYNAFTIKLITDNLPVKSIMDLDGGKPWDKKWIEMGGKTYSLNQIEHDIIRPVFNEPRIHFAVVCAANSCPPLASYAFTATNVDTKLEDLTVAFINNPKFNQLSEDKVTLSPIFDWYGKDFGDVPAYISKYADTSVSSKAKVKFTSYDWGLNKQ